MSHQNPTRGDRSGGPLVASARTIHTVLCEELISRMVREAEEIITGRLSRFVTPRKMANA